MNLAVIDLGTNTFNLLICTISNNLFSILKTKIVAPKIGKNSMQARVLQADAMLRGVESLRDFQVIIQEYDCQKVLLIGTSALRNAKNAQDFIEMVEQEFNYSIEVITGLQEAEYVFMGNRLAYDWGNATALILDIGGGSNECIICNHSRILWKHSFENGMQRILEAINPVHPYTDKNIADIHAFLEATFLELLHISSLYTIDCLVGSSGPFDTYRAILEAKGCLLPSDAPSSQIERSDFKELFSSLIYSSNDELLAIPGMNVARLESLPVAACITNFVIDRLQIPTIIQSDYSLKEGVAYSIFSSTQ